MLLNRMRPSIILFGDSITEQAFGTVDGSIIGWASQLSSAYSRRSHVLNGGFAGYNTRFGLDVLPRLFDSHDNGTHTTLFWTVFFGANDGTLPGERQHVPLGEYGDNIKSMVHMIRNKSNVESNTNNISDPTFPIILITPPPVDVSMWDAFCLQNFGEKRGKRCNEHVYKYALKLKEIGNELNCSVLDLFEAFDGYDKRKLLCDGLHLNTLGNRLVYE